MLTELVKKAKQGEPVFIPDVRSKFREYPGEKIPVHCALELTGGKGMRHFALSLPVMNSFGEDEYRFIHDYITAEIFNILTNLGGNKLTFYTDTGNTAAVKLLEEMDAVFGIGLPLAERKGFGRCINVIDRMISAIHGSDHPPFSFEIKNIKEMPENGPARSEGESQGDGSIFISFTEGIEDKVICGIDVGGTDIKTALAVHGKLTVLKEYDWFPEKFGYARLLNDPILLMVRLVRLKASVMEYSGDPNDEIEKIKPIIDRAMQKDAEYGFIFDTVSAGERILGGENLIQLDAVGMCFPDVVVKDKIVGGEVTKTRGMRENPEIDYEIEYAKITNLDNELLTLCKPGGVVKNTNDGPMAAFTAAAELAAGEGGGEVAEGVFAHTLGTELGTGWVDGRGTIPEIPLETYNMIIDIGSYPEREYAPDDVRSINNYNSGLPGTLQRYTSQNGVFRLGLKLLTGKNDHEAAELFRQGYLTKTTVDGEDFITVPTSPKDMRKAFLEYMMEKAETGNEEAFKEIFRQIGVFLAVTFEDTQYILNPESNVRHLFGRLVKRKACFDLMIEGGKTRAPEMEMRVADDSIANTTLMKQLARNKEFTVAQFAQAVGAIYYGNMGLISR
jgi:hypothetical protein